MAGAAPSLIRVAGPTASVKSALALALAEALGGTIVNADSMQVYRDLRVLTARPSPADEALLPHRLYGVIDAAEAVARARDRRDRRGAPGRPGADPGRWHRTLYSRAHPRACRGAADPGCG